MPKVLIVEDEMIIAMEIQKTVERLGYEVCGVVKNYESACERFKECMADIVLMDINLGKNKKDGIETAEALKEIANVPIVYLTAYNNESIIERAAKTCPAGYIIKPFKEEQAKATLALALKQKEKLEVLYKIGVKELDPVKLKVMMEALESVDTHRSYSEVKDEIAQRVLIDSLIEIYEIKEPTKEDYKEFVLRMEVVKDLLVNL